MVAAADNPTAVTDDEALAKSKMDRLNSVIFKSIVRGGLYGAMLSIPTSLFLTWRSPTFRWLGVRGKIFYHTILIAAGANFVTEKEILRFEKKIQYEKKIMREELIRQSIENGDLMYYSASGDDDSDMMKVNHKGGTKKRSDVANARLSREQILASSGKIYDDRTKDQKEE